jgi:CDP-diacylglycerol---serine O-phosphatidyltransferase
LTIGTVLYLASLPFGFVAYRNYERQAAAETAAASNTDVAAAAPTEATASPRGQATDGSERPTRLN